MLDFLWRTFGLCRHEWGPWGKPFAFGFTAYQRRSCLLCGIAKQRSIGLASDADASDASKVVEPWEDDVP